MCAITKLVLLAIVTYGYIAIVDAGNNGTTGPITYVAYMEEKLGFYRVIDDTTHKDSLYKERVLTINQGDTVIWLNDADTATLTVVSEQGLWDKTNSKLVPPDRRFNYTFVMSGTYAVYIDEYRNLFHQTIIVKPKEGYPTPTPSFVPTPVPTNVSISTTNPVNSTTNETTSRNSTAQTVELSKSKNSTVNSTANVNYGKIVSIDMTGVGILNVINTMSNLILSLSVMVIAYKIWKDY